MLARDVMHAHVEERDLRRRGLTVAALHQPGWWLLREPNGHLQVATLAHSEAHARLLAGSLLYHGQGTLPPWAFWEALGYRIVQPVGPCFQPGRPAEWWGRAPRHRYWQTQVRVVP